ncbi:MAG: RNA pseudouridine synthase [Treponema sp.]|jgi:23S rRNA pseudouridine1911/1915/1917 synthase|nr:RNA pseudouridine synthase [Treponema sp.]
MDYKDRNMNEIANPPQGARLHPYTAEDPKALLHGKPGIDGSRILYLDKACVVINKMPGEAVQGGDKGMIDLPRLLGEQLQESPKRPRFFPAAVHRLDVPVSGCCLFARTPQALRFLNAQFAQGKGEKHYWGILEKPGPSLAVPETGELVHWIKTDGKRNKSIAYDEPGPDRKRGALQYRITGYGDHYLFMEITLITGRHHQIRAQLARLGLHIKGDLKYGARRSEKAGGIRLHAYSLGFPHPSEKGAMLRLTALPPFQDRLWSCFLRPALTGEGASS